MVIKLSLGSGLRCSSVDEAKGVICCLREEQMLARKKPKKKDWVRCCREAKTFEPQTTSQSDVTRQAGWLFLLDIKCILSVIFLFRLSPGQE